RDDHRAVVSLCIHDRDAHARSRARQARDTRCIDTGSHELLQKKSSEVVIADRASHANLAASLRCCNCLITALAPELWAPCEATDSLTLTWPVRRIDHDVVMEAADHDDHGFARTGHAMRLFRGEPNQEFVDDGLTCDSILAPERLSKPVVAV